MLKKKCIDLESRVKKLEEESMPRPTHPEVIKYFIDTGNILRDVRKDINRTQTDPITEIMNKLGLDKNKALKYHRKTSTATARAVVKFKCPNPEPNIGLANVDKSIIDEIIAYTKYSNPNDPVSDSELRKAMGNYFASLTYQNKDKNKKLINNQRRTNHTTN